LLHLNVIIEDGCGVKCGVIFCCCSGSCNSTILTWYLYAMSLLTNYSRELPYFLAFAILARRAKFSWKQNICIFTGGLFYARIITTIQNVVNSTLWYGFLILFIVAFIRYYILLGDRPRNTSIRDPSDKCSLGVFMGSG
jgi:hypothetical protein